MTVAPHHSRVLVTRAAGQARPFCDALAAAGLEPVCIPTIAIQPLDDLRALDAALRRLADYRYAIFPSANAARIVVDRMAALGVPPSVSAGLRIVAGSSTARVLAGAGLPATIVPSPFGAEAALAALAGEQIEGAPVLLLRALEGREALGNGLRVRGARVDEIPVYATAPVTEALALASALGAGEIDIVTFFSPSAVLGFVQALAHAVVAPESLPRRPLVACIGATTAAAARERGWPADGVAADTTAESLVAMVMRLLSRPPFEPTAFSRPGAAAFGEVATPGQRVEVAVTR